MTSSATSTEPAPRRPAAPAADAGFHPWHFFALLSMIGATAAVMMARDTHPVALLLLSAAVLASGFVALALHQALAGFIGARHETQITVSTREALEKEKALVLRSIKELEFDRAMKKVGERDYADMSTRLRARAMVLMEQLSAEPAEADASALREMRTSGSAKPADAEASALQACPTCGGTNDHDARFCKHCGGKLIATIAMVLCLLGLPAMSAAQQGMPDPKQMSGVPLAMPDVPVGTLSVRVIRGTFTNNIPNQPVEFTVDGAKRVVNTDASGRAQLEGLRAGTRVRALTTVDGERLESQEVVMAQSGIRIMLVATDPEAAKRAEEDKALAGAAAVKGLVVLGPETRVIAEFSDDRLSIFYVLQIINSARTPVDIGGPLIFDLPREARGATVLDDPLKRATANGPRITVLGPFAPGPTNLQIAYELPYSGDTAHLVQRWPAAVEQTTVLVLQTGTLAISSPQLATSREMSDQGQRVIVGGGPGLAAGQTLELQISGLPHHARWPRIVALTLAGIIALAGLWAAATPRPRRAAA